MHLAEDDRIVDLYWHKQMGVHFSHTIKNSRGRPLSVLIQVISDQTPNLFVPLCCSTLTQQVVVHPHAFRRMVTDGLSLQVQMRVKSVAVGFFLYKKN